jgi:hypothetical protein
MARKVIPGGAAPVSLGLTRDSKPDAVARAIIAEAQRRGYSRDETIAVLATAIQESGLRPGAVSPNGKWRGIFQQDTSYPGRDDPNLNITAFMDRLDVKRRSPGASPDPWKTVFWLQQRPADETAELSYQRGRKGYLTEIKHRAAEAADYVDRYGGQVAEVKKIDQNRPDFNEIDQLGWDADDPHGSVRSRPPINFFLHTQEGGGNATDLAAFLRGTKGNGAVSYHYTIHQAPDGGVTVVDVIDTDLYSWSVLNANVFSINLCFAGSRAAWSREQWLKQGKAIDVAAYLAVQDCRKYNFATSVIAPPYGQPRPGISDHKYVTQCLGVGTHTDVGDNFPWDVFAAAVAKYVNADTPGAQPPPVLPAPPKGPPDSLSDRQLLEDIWEQLRGDDGKGWKQLGKNDKGQDLTLVDAVSEIKKSVVK